MRQLLYLEIWLNLLAIQNHDNTGYGPGGRVAVSHTILQLPTCCPLRLLLLDHLNLINQKMPKEKIIKPSIKIKTKTFTELKKMTQLNMLY